MQVDHCCWAMGQLLKEKLKVALDVWSSSDWSSGSGDINLYVCLSCFGKESKSMKMMGSQNHILEWFNANSITSVNYCKIQISQRLIQENWIMSRRRIYLCT